MESIEKPGQLSQKLHSAGSDVKAMNDCIKHVELPYGKLCTLKHYINGIKAC